MLVDCPNLTQVTKAAALKQIDLPETVTRIEYNAFDLSGLESIELPENLNHIGSYAFASTQLRSFRMPDGFTASDFGSYALAYNYRLKTAYMGRNMDYSTFSDFTAFYRCDSLETLRLYAGTPPSASSYYFGFRSNCVLEVPDDPNVIEAYQQVEP
ncbi:MAG: leucine-rich repeat domain-containing protein [Prevotella sp.]|nr:leucine-rich repeat domain-containing protein [Prevotella sp.]